MKRQVGSLVVSLAVSLLPASPLGDPGIPDGEIASYLIEEESVSRSFSERVRSASGVNDGVGQACRDAAVRGQIGHDRYRGRDRNLDVAFFSAGEDEGREFTIVVRYRGIEPVEAEDERSDLTDSSSSSRQLESCAC